MKIAIVGAGPAGLYLALLVKKRRPDWTVSVLEQNRADATFGFGVVMADAGLARLRAADAATHDVLAERMVFRDRQAIVHGHTPIVIKRPNTGGAITRLELLEVLQAAATGAGAEIRFGVRIAELADLAKHGLADADVIVGADGVNSIVRGAREAEFGTTCRYLTNHFAWYGTDKVFAHPALVFRCHRGGAFVAHYYPYSATRSTFVGECDHATWLALGMDSMSEEARQALIEEVYAEELDGQRLISNNSTWRQFPVIRNRAWHAGNVVLVGDALSSAHFSIGSGTRIAMEDSIALADALLEVSLPVPARLERFTVTRGPAKAKLIAASERSFDWYERIGEWLDRYTPHEFVLAFMTRTGRVDVARLTAQFPELVAELRRAGALPANTETAR